MGSNNMFNQQYHILHQQGQQNPNPRSSFLDDLIPIINNWRAQKKAVLMCIDANKNIHKPKSTGMARLFQETDLIDLHHHHHPNSLCPPMHNQGSHPIDLCAGSREFLEALWAAWYLPFGKPLGLCGNHQTLGLDFDIDILFKHQVTLNMPAIMCRVNSNNPALIKEFCMHAIAASQKANMYGQIHQLLTKEHFSPNNHKDLEQIDAELTQLLVSADQQCKKPGTHPWSLELHKAYIIHHYWTLKLSSKCTGRQYLQALTKIENQFTTTQLKISPTNSISAHLQAAQKITPRYKERSSWQTENASKI